MLLGAVFRYGSVVDYFHLIPVHGVKHLEPTNEVQAVAMKVTAVVIVLGCILLIFSGIWRGFRPHRTSASRRRPHRCQMRTMSLLRSMSLMAPTTHPLTARNTRSARSSFFRTATFVTYLLRLTKRTIPS